MKWRNELSNKEILEIKRMESIEGQVDNKLKAQCIELALRFCGDNIKGVSTSAITDIAQKFHKWITLNPKEIEVDL